MHGLRSLLITLVTLTVSAPALLQAQAPTIRTATPAGVLAGTTHAFIPAATVIQQPTVRSVFGNVQGSTASAGFSIAAEGSQGVRIRGQASASGPTPFGAPISAGTTRDRPAFEAYVVELLFPGAQRGNLNVDLNTAWSSSSPGIFDLVSVDVQFGTTSISSIQPDGRVRRAVPVQFSNGLTVRIVVRGSVSSTMGRNAQTSYDVRVWLDPGAVIPADFQIHAPPCLGTYGPWLIGSDLPAGTSHYLQFQARNVRSGPPVALVFGVNPTPLPIPGSNCALQLLPTSWLVRTSDPLGVVDWRFAIPVPLPPSTVYAQAVVLEPPAYLTTTALQVIFR